MEGGLYKINFFVTIDATAALHGNPLCCQTFVVADKAILELSLANISKIIP